MNNKSSNRNILQNEVILLEQESKLLKKVKYRKSIIHEDLNIENIVIDKNGHVNFIDFGESHRAEVISDIAIAIKEIIVNNNGIDLGLVRDYLNSYQKVIRLGKDEIGALFFLMKRRVIFMIAYLSNKQKTNESVELKKRISIEIKVLKIFQKNRHLIKNFIKKYE